jgi:hypothetical protein
VQIERCPSARFSRAFLPSMPIEERRPGIDWNGQGPFEPWRDRFNQVSAPKRITSELSLRSA